jgi:hypothetical protein
MWTPDPAERVDLHRSCQVRVNRILCSAIPAIVLGIVAHATQARAIELTPGETLNVTFTESGPPSVLGGLFTGAGGLLDDTLAFEESDNLGVPASGVAQLFDGTILLGTVDFTAYKLQGFGFVASGSAFTAVPTGIVNDWTSIINGTINGRLDITLDTTADISISLFNLGIGTGGSGIFTASPQPTITGESVLATTPLPRTLTLFGAGLCCLGLLAWCRKRNVQTVFV